MNLIKMTNGIDTKEVSNDDVAKFIAAGYKEVIETSEVKSGKVFPLDALKTKSVNGTTFIPSDFSSDACNFKAEYLTGKKVPHWVKLVDVPEKGTSNLRNFRVEAGMINIALEKAGVNGYNPDNTANENVVYSITNGQIEFSK